MASKPPITNPKFTQFLSALTDTDQLSAADKRMAVRDQSKATRNERYEAWMLARGAAHVAYAAHLTSCVANVCDRPTKAEDKATHEQACHMLLVAAQRYLGLPAVTKDHAADRRGFINLASKAFGGSNQFRAWKVLIATSQPA